LKRLLENGISAIAKKGRKELAHRSFIASRGFDVDQLAG
jgi:hypothetical protein